jgi:hypothetical protein
VPENLSRKCQSCTGVIFESEAEAGDFKSAMLIFTHRNEKIKPLRAAIGISM